MCHVLDLSSIDLQDDITDLDLSTGSGGSKWEYGPDARDAEQRFRRTSATTNHRDAKPTAALC